MTEPKYLPIPKAFEIVTGFRPNPATCWRWWKSGKLETWKLCNRRVTTIEAVEDFVRKQSGPQAPASPTSPAAMRRRDKAVARQLDKELGLA